MIFHYRGKLGIYSMSQKQVRCAGRPEKLSACLRIAIVLVTRTMSRQNLLGGQDTLQGSAHNRIITGKRQDVSGTIAIQLS